MSENLSKEIIKFEENQLSQFKSLYYLIKGKRDTDIKLFTGFKQFSYDDLLELNDKVYKKLELHDLVTDIVKVTIGLENKEIKNFGSWQEFQNSDWNISPTTKYISIEWDFNLILPNQLHKIPQTHTMRVRIGNNLKPSEMIQIIFQGSEESDLDESQSQMSCRIDFVNSQICNELKAVVSDWYDALPNNSEEHKLIRFILKHEVKIQNIVILSFITASIILINYLFRSFYNAELSIFPNDKDHKLFLFLTCSIPIIYLFLQSGRLYANRMMRKQIGKLKRNPMFTFTKGDKNKIKEIENENNKRLMGIFYTIIIGLSVNGFSALIGIAVDYILTK